MMIMQGHNMPLQLGETFYKKKRKKTKAAHQSLGMWGLEQCDTHHLTFFLKRFNLFNAHFFLYNDEG